MDAVVYFGQRRRQGEHWRLVLHVLDYHDHVKTGYVAGVLAWFSEWILEMKKNRWILLENVKKN